MNKALNILGVFALIAVVLPGAVAAGVYLGVVPGVLLAVCPTLFVYGSVIQIACRAGRIATWAGRLAVVVAVLAIGTIPALLLNWPTHAKVSVLTLQDIDNSGPIDVGTTVALLQPDPWVARHSDPECGAICQVLLYNGDVERVLIGLSTDAFGGRPAAQKLFSFKLQRPTRCTRSALSALPRSTNAVSKRQLAGECVVAEQVSTDALRDANTIVSQTTYGYPALTEKLQPFGMSGDFAQAVRVEIFTKQNLSAPVLRKTAISAKPLVLPLSMLPTMAADLNAWGMQIPGPIGWGRWRKLETSPSLGNIEFVLEQSGVLGRALRPVEDTVTLDGLRSLMAEALEDRSRSGDDINLIYHHLSQTLQAKKGLSQADIDLLAKLVSDPRFGRPFGLDQLVSAANLDMSSLAEALSKRIASPAKIDLQYVTKDFEKARAAMAR